MTGVFRSEFGAGGRLDPSKPRARTRVLHIDAIEKQHMDVDIQIERTAEALDQGDGAGLCWVYAIFLMRCVARVR